MNKFNNFIFTCCLYLFYSSANAGTCESNTAPVIQNKSPSLTAIAGENYSHDFNAIDSDGDLISYGFSAWPDTDNMSITNSGYFEWTVPRKDVFSINVFASDNICGSDSYSFIVNVSDPNNTSPILQNKTPPDTAYVGLPYSYNLSPYDFDGDSVEYILYKPTVSDGFYIDSNGSIQWTPSESELGEHEIFIMVRDTFGGTDSFSYHVNVLAPLLPPDPVDIAPDLSTEEVTSLKDATEFLYSGENPIQQNVIPDTIKALSASVLRGKVTSRDNTALSGVVITIKDHPEFGNTLSRADGKYDMAVNGGKTLTLVYQKDGYLPIQRKINPQWRQFNTMEDVVLIPLDNQVSNISFNHPVSQVARGSVQNDLDGNRQATLVIPQGTSATLHLSDGSTQNLSTGTLRATEYTVGSNGALAMPGELPPTTAYTYAVELSLDEAIATNAENVEFNQTLAFYVENFLNLPVGEIVPSGYYDRNTAKWIPSDNGKIIRVLSIDNGLANIDIDGSGNPANSEELTELGVNDDERAQLATLYSSGDSLWRVPINHFTPFDLNFPFGLPDTAEPPPLDPEVANENEPPQEDNNECEGCIIEPQSQTLGESIPIVGTNQSLHYHSGRVPGYKVGRTISIPVSSANIPEGLRDIELIIEAAGQTFRQTFAPNANQNYTFEWNGQDAYGRDIPNTQAKITLNYRYHWVIYSSRDDIGRSFGRITDQLSAIGNGRISATRGGGTNLGVVSRTWTKQLTHYVPNSDALGGWTLSSHHSYDPQTKTLYKGDGTSRTIDSLPLIAQTVAGNGIQGFSGDGDSAVAASIGSISDIKFGADGSIYLADAGNRRIRKIDPEGNITTIAGNGTNINSGDGGEAIEAGLATPQGIALAPNGDLYISTFFGHTVRKVDSNGIISTVAGSGNSGYIGENIPATEANFNQLKDVATDPEGNLVILDTSNPRIYKVDGNDIVYTIAGTGYFNFSGDGGLATEASFRTPESIAFDHEGNLWVADMLNDRLRIITPDGIISSPQLSGGGFAGDGGPLENARFNEPRQIAFAPDGSLYIADRRNKRIRKVSPEGIINTVVGTGNDYSSSDIIVDGAIALKENISQPNAIGVSPDGELYYYHPSARIRKLSPALPGFSRDDIFIASESGDLVYIFNSEGLHLETRDAMTGHTTLSFGYVDGRLSSITDAYNNISTVGRNENGVIQYIDSPYGQRTLLRVDENGYLDQVTNPAQHQFNMQNSNDGLLATFEDPKEQANIFEFDTSGRLEEDLNAGMGGWNFDTNETPNGYETTMTSQEGRVFTFSVENHENGNKTFSKASPDGTIRTTVSEAKGNIVTTEADGTTISVAYAPDPRFGMLSPIPETYTITTPSGLNTEILTSRSAELSEPTNILDLNTWSEEVSINGNVFVTSFDANSRTYTDTTPEGRVTQRIVNENNRLTMVQASSFAPMYLQYDDNGRLFEIAFGEGFLRPTTQTTYYESGPNNGLIESYTDILDRTYHFDYDLAGRLREYTLPNDRSITYDYDENGNMISITSPGMTTHQFNYNAFDIEERYTPPTVEELTEVSTQFNFNLDKQVEEIIRSDGKNIVFDRNTRGQLTTITIPEDTYTQTYYEESGRVHTIENEDTMLSYDYDGFLLTGINITGAVNASVNRIFDSQFRIQEESVNNDFAVNIEYDNDGLVDQVGNLIIHRDILSGNFIRSTELGVVTTSRDYDDYGHLKSVSALVNGEPVYNVTYIKNDSGRIDHISEEINGEEITWEYTYDLVDRIKTATRNGILTSYNFDDNGNRTSRTLGVFHETGNVDAQDRMQTYGDYEYSYNAHGEITLIRNIVNEQETTFTHDAIGNLRQVQLPNGRVIDYILDGEHRRVAKRVDGEIAQAFIYSGQLNPIAELNRNNEVVSRFIYADKSNVPSYMIRDGVIYRVISDHLGSPRLVINTSTGQIVQQMAFDEFGRVLQDTNPGFQPFGYAGGIYDRDTEFVRFGAREYDPYSGRWLSKDPLRFAGGDTNLYAYVHNNPVNLIDPTGLEATLCEAMRELVKTADSNPLLNGTPFSTDHLLGEVIPAGGHYKPPVNAHFTDDRSNLDYDIQYIQTGWSIAKTYGGGSGVFALGGYMIFGAGLGSVLSGDYEYFEWENIDANGRGQELGERGAMRYETFEEFVDDFCREECDK